MPKFFNLSKGEENKHYKHNVYNVLGFVGLAYDPLTCDVLLRYGENQKHDKYNYELLYRFWNYYISVAHYRLFTLIWHR